MLKIFDFRAYARLGSIYSQDALSVRKLRKFLRLREAVTKGPLAVHVFTRFNRSLHDLQMMSNLHRDGNDVYLGRGYQFSNIVEGSPKSERGRRPLGTGQAGVGGAYDLVAIGQRTQRWYMGASRPTPARLQSNDTNSEALFCHCVPPWCRRSVSTAAVVLRFVYGARRSAIRSAAGRVERVDGSGMVAAIQ